MRFLSLCALLLLPALSALAAAKGQPGPDDALSAIPLEAPATKGDNAALVAPHKKPKDEFDVGAHGDGDDEGTGPLARKRGIVGLSVAGSYTLGAGSGVGGSLNVHLAYRLPFAGLGVALEPGVAFGSATTVAAAGTSISLSVPVLATVSVFVEHGVVRFLAGPSFELTALRLSAPGLTAESRSPGIGFAAGLGYMFQIGPGAVMLDVRYGLAPVQALHEQGLRHALRVGAGYGILF